MIPIVICVIGGSIAGNYFFGNQDLGYFFFSLIGLTLGWMIAILIGSLPRTGTREVCKEVEKLVSLRSANITGGDLFLGSGSINSFPYYIYYQLLEGGGYRLRKIRADLGNVVVFEEDRHDGILETCWTSSNVSFLWGFSDKEYTYKFRIPMGSIKRDYTL